MFRLVFLDLDDTIFDFGYAEAETLRTTLRHYGITPTEEAVRLYSEINDAHWKRLERGELTRREVQIGRFACLFEALGVSCSAEEVNSFYMQTIASCYRFVDGAEELLADLRAAGCRLYVVSNGSRSVQNGRLKCAGLTDVFDGIFLSEDIGIEKPNRVFFDRCFSEVPNMKLDEAIILGDSLTSDILGGINAGIATCWFNPKGKARRSDIIPDFEISHLRDFLSIVMQSNRSIE